MNAIIENWPLALFKKSVLKQHKLEEITNLLGKTESLVCLDIGSDNGVISYLLRQRGGSWKSADLDENAVHSIRELVKSNVYQIDSLHTPFNDNEFDRVVIVDFLEHIHTDKEFVDELFRIMKPGGELIINVPHTKNSLLRLFRLSIGQTDEKHGHLRPGYTVEDVRTLLGRKFTLLAYKTYSKFFSEFIDTLITFAYGILKGSEQQESRKGVLVTGSDLSKYKKLFRVYTLIYPVVWVFSRLDLLLFFQSGYMLILKAKVNK
jgi:ubiquinone/menaquinone biosynthesis C-methylase UbiE